MEYGRKQIDMKVLFGSVVYRMGEIYLDDFFSSIDRQTDKGFSVVLLNDDMNMERLKKKLSKYALDVEIIHIKDKTPVQLRIELIREAKQKQADLLIMGDCDDYFSDSRIANVIYTYVNHRENAFFYNELRDEYGMPIMPELPEHVSDFKEIGEYNFLGMSNTALNIKKISFEFIDSLEEYGYDIFDWYLFSRLLLEGKCGKKVNGCSTIYRIHENNIAGIQVLNENNIRREIEVKRNHYNSLRKYNEYYEGKYKQFKNRENNIVVNRSEKYFWWNLLRGGLLK